jgi:MFS family permease
MSAASGSSSDDPYAGSRASLRETLKWLVGLFGALAAAIVGGSPLTGFGSLPWGWRLWLVIISGALGLACVFCFVALVVKFMIGEPFFLSKLEKDKKLRDFVDRHRDELLPPDHPNIGRFLMMRRDSIKILGAMNLSKNLTSREIKQRDEAQKFLGEVNPFLFRLASLVAYEELRQKVMGKARLLIALAAVAVLCFAVFAWATNPPKLAENLPSAGKLSAVENRP